MRKGALLYTGFPARLSAPVTRVLESAHTMRFAEINWVRLPMKGWGETITAIGLMVIIILGVPEVPRIMGPAMVVGVVYGLLRYWWWNR